MEKSADYKKLASNQAKSNHYRYFGVKTLLIFILLIPLFSKCDGDNISVYNECDESGTSIIELLRIEPFNVHQDNVVSMDWGDASSFMRYVMHFNVPAAPVNGNGIDFSH